jgi:hypothetical protein
MSLVYRKVDCLLSANAGGEAQEGDSLLLDTGRRPRNGELTLVRRGGADILCRWCAAPGDRVLGVVIGIKRRL